MIITVKSISRDTKNFFYNQFINIILIVFLCTFITMIIGYISIPNEVQIPLLNKEKNNLIDNTKIFETIGDMSPKQQKILLYTSILSSFSILTGHAILVSIMILMIQFVSNGQHINIPQIIISTFLELPRLFILVFLIALLVQIGILLLIIPGILSAIALSFAPLMLIKDKMGLFAAIRNSTKLSWSNIHLVAPAVIIWLLAKTLILLFSMLFIIITPSITVIIANILNNLIFAILLIYLFRVYMLIYK